jgi:hypothetical protein
VSYCEWSETRRGLSPRLSNFALEYDFRRIQEIQAKLKLNGKHQLLAYADHVIIVVGNVDIIKKNKDAFLNVIKQVGLKANIQKTNHMVM